ncbi:bifunctional adenosylcobinamide kinase/adenosylcobinamide-phosphate guanylyltransferase [Mycobacteroides chelonae]|nr:bifunctional adenosylcobinamide kinase/adenosylcobinamide-phosphate guanylyltransferase [Mycobacteroides chelonae]
MATTLVLGGIRSGKSRFAESLLPASGPVRYLATGTSVHEDEAWTQGLPHTGLGVPMAGRRPRQPISPRNCARPTRCRRSSTISGWLTARMDARAAWDRGGEVVASDIDELVDAISSYGSELVIVSPEVGLTIVPATASGRLFADQLGALNQAVAQHCQRVLLVVAGQPLAIKGAAE